MASSPLIFSLLFIFLAVGANARPGRHFHPCKTLFISSFTVSSSSSSSFNDEQNNNLFLSNPNPNPNENHPRFFTIFDFYPTQQPLEIFVDRRLDFDSDFILPRSVPFRFEKPEIHHQVTSSSLGGSSLRDRTKDILSVVVALLFGVGCGALTSATMYLVWSVITNRHHDDDDDFTDDDDSASLKKIGYSKIPAPPAKEVV